MSRSNPRHKYVEILKVKNPHIQSRAALVALRRQYRKKFIAKMETEIEEAKALARKENKEYRTRTQRYMDRIIERDGKLVCAYCGRDDLQPPPYHNAEEKARTASVDHIVPRRGLCRTSPLPKHARASNRNVACIDCNQAKNNLDEDEFAALKDRIILPWTERVRLEKDDPKELAHILEEMKELRRKISCQRHGGCAYKIVPELK